MLVGQFWGTSDAAGIPTPMCRCPVCEEARCKGGRSVRLRSGFRLSDKVMLDLGSDAVVQCMKYGDMNDVKHVLLSHTHEDHFNTHMLMQMMWASDYYKGPMTFYLTDKAYEMAEHLQKSEWMLKGWVTRWQEQGLLSFKKLEYNVCVEIDEFKIIPFRGNHVGNVKEDSAMYLVEFPDGRKLFYGLDSGRYYLETIEALKKHVIDIYITESTFGIKRTNHPGHMSIWDVQELITVLYNQGTLKDDSKVYLTHINHSSSHEQMLEATKLIKVPVPMIVAYDGMKIL